MVHNEKLDITVDRALVHMPVGCEDTDNDDGNIDKKMLSVLKERNALSRLLNEKQQRVGQLQCEVRFLHFCIFLNVLINFKHFKISFPRLILQF
jgi:hypothetical protein